MATVKLDGNVCHTSGEMPAVGAKAPDFRLVGADLRDVSLETYRGKAKLLNIVPSLETGICAKSTRIFNERASEIPTGVILVVSADLPFAMKRFCTAEAVRNVIPLSMMRGRKFAKDYGVLIADGAFEGLCARAVVVIDASDKIVYTELVPEIGDEPNYDAALAAAGARAK
jgi:thiol peroxidase